MQPQIKYYRITDSSDLEDIRAWATTIGNNAHFIESSEGCVVAITCRLGVSDTWPGFESEFAGRFEEIPQ